MKHRIRINRLGQTKDSPATVISNNAGFSIAYSFLDDTRETELSMNVNGTNILAFERNGSALTTRWNLDERVAYRSYG